jgi:membrane-bound metal-dependent hydrolase YbcI (DUF457 family)
MPGYKGHTVGGLAAFGLLHLLLVSFNPTFLTSIEWLVCALFGALLPDIDIKSRGQNIFYVLLAGAYAGALVAGKISWSPFFVVAALFPMLVSHRGISHRLWFVILISGAVGLGLSTSYPSYAQAAWFNALFLGAGMLSHLVLDKWISG